MKYILRIPAFTVNHYLHGEVATWPYYHSQVRIRPFTRNLSCFLYNFGSARAAAVLSAVEVEE